MENKVDQIITNTIKDLKSILDVNSVIGSPIKVGSAVTIMPICKLTMGLVTGGGDVGKERFKKVSDRNYLGGSGTGISYSPVGVIAVIGDSVKYISLDDPVPYYDIARSVENTINNIVDKVKSNEKNNKK